MGMDNFSKWKANALARAAADRDDVDAFQKALMAGADLRGEDLGSSLWNWVVGYRALECFEAMLPNMDLNSPESKSRLHALTAMAAVDPKIQKMLDCAIKERDRQSHARHFESIIIGVGVADPESPKPPRRAL